ncbi:MAG: FAD-dependent oxidoreductase [Rhodobacteraceae bacterium]|nr:FAD-dependent oxidoreductase [Paracoccaceae bacterium]
MGAGILGLATAWECQRRGATVRVIEAQEIGAGSSGGYVGALAPHVPENWNAKKAFQLESLLMAEGFWASVANASGHDPGYGRMGRLQPLVDMVALARARDRISGAETHWQGLAEWRVVPVADDGWMPASPTGWLVEDTLSARLHPRQALTALAAAVVVGGGRIETGRRFRPTDLFGSEGFGGLVLWATGVDGLNDLSADLAYPVGNGVKGQAALLAYDASGQPQIFADGLHIVPHGDGTVAVGSTSEREFADGALTDGALDALVARVRVICPALAKAPVIGRWAGVRPRAASRAPLIGPWPGRPGHYVANGGFKIGLGMAPKIATVMADLMLDVVSGIPEEFLPRAAL